MKASPGLARPCALGSLAPGFYFASIALKPPVLEPACTQNLKANSYMPLQATWLYGSVVAPPPPLPSNPSPPNKNMEILFDEHGDARETNKESSSRARPISPSAANSLKGRGSQD